MAVDYIGDIRTINESLYNKDCLGQFNAKCVVRSITTEIFKKAFIANLLKRFGDNNSGFALNRIQIRNVRANSVDECGEQMKEFLRRKTNRNFHVYSFARKGRPMSLCYIAGGAISYRESAATSFVTVAKAENISNNIYIFCSNYGEDIKGAISAVMNDIGVSEGVLKLFDGYIQNRMSTYTLDYSSYSSMVSQGRQRRMFAGRRKLDLDFARIKEQKLYLKEFNNEFIIKILSARGSYDIFCPVCADIPIEAILKERKGKPSRSLIVLENSSARTKVEFPYVVLIACDRCKEKLSATLSRSELNDNNVALTLVVAHGQHEKVYIRHAVELSPINMSIMKELIN